jgi:hypothetical protein
MRSFTKTTCARSAAVNTASSPSYGCPKIRAPEYLQIKQIILSLLVLALEFLDKVVNKIIVEVFTTQVSVAYRVYISRPLVTANVNLSRAHSHRREMCAVDCIE